MREVGHIQTSFDSSDRHLYDSAYSVWAGPEGVESDKRKEGRAMLLPAIVLVGAIIVTPSAAAAEAAFMALGRVGIEAVFGPE